MWVREVLYLGQCLLGKSFAIQMRPCLSLCPVFFQTFLCRNEADSCIWMPCPSRVFSPRSLYRSLEEMSLETIPNSLLWHGLAPPRVEVFCWLVAFNKVSIVDNLKRRGFSLETSSNLCSLYGEGEMIDHLFV